MNKIKITNISQKKPFKAPLLPLLSINRPLPQLEKKHWEVKKMDSRCRARGLVKGMLGPLHGEAMACSRGSRKAKPAPSNSSSCSCHVSFMVHHQEKPMAQSNHRVVHDAMNVHEASFLNSYGIAVDEHIDRKAANYISSVQERFRLEGLTNWRSRLAT